MAISVRKMTTQDLAEVDRIQKEAYDASLRESVAVFEEKLTYFPDGCWLCETDAVAIGYLFSHPSRLSAPPTLNKFFGPNTDEPDCYFIHDVAVQPSARRMGVGCRLVKKALRIAVNRGFAVVALVSVQNSQKYWQRFGFQPLTDLNDVMLSIREAYGDGACYMGRLKSNKPLQPTSGAGAEG